MPQLSRLNVVMISYDMRTDSDSSINSFIKEQLMRNGFHDNANFNSSHDQILSDTLPETTLWKVSSNPTEVIGFFKGACDAYNVQNSSTPAKRAHGKAFAVCNNEYAAVIV